MNVVSINDWTPPPPPRPQGMQANSQRNALANSPGGMPAVPGGAPAAAPPPPKPSHGETVAALRHFNAIAGGIRVLLADPAAGRSDMKSKIIDAVSQMVAQRMIPPGTAVAQLSDVPSTPFGQKQWLEQHYQQAMQAAAMVIDHHTASHQGIPEEMINKSSDLDSHMETMRGLMGHYPGGGHA
jgi:hypothetical protein